MQYESNECGICLELIQKTNVCIITCGHTFCLSCILKNAKYNNCCPYCKIDIIENSNNKVDEEDEVEQEEDEIEQEEDEPEEIHDLYGCSIDDCYYYPVNIENVNILAEVINEVTAGLYQTDKGMGWILGILSIINDNEKDYDRIFENKSLLAEHAKMILTEAIFIYKRTILLKKFLQSKIMNICAKMNEYL